MQASVPTPSTAAPALALHRDKALLPNLDGIRALACLLVVLSHMPWPVRIEAFGGIGVGIFFVLSGFLMSYLYGHAHWDLAAVTRYGIARFSRIAPIYWVVIAVCVLISYAQPDEDFLMRISGSTAIARHALFAGNVSVFWSIPLEIQYYGFFLLVWWALAQQRRVSYALPALVLLCAGLILTHALWPGLVLPSKLHFFLAGTLAGLVPRGSWTSPREKSVLAGLQLGAVAVLASPMWLYPDLPSLYLATELGFAFAAAIYLLSLPSPWSSAVLAAPPMRAIGQASFSIYLMHVLVFHYGMRLLNLSHAQYEPLWLPLGIAAVAMPLLLSRWVEIPLQRVTRRFLDGLLLPVLRRAALRQA